MEVIIIEVVRIDRQILLSFITTTQLRAYYPSIMRVENVLIEPPESPVSSASPTSAVILTDTVYAGENVIVLRPLTTLSPR